MLYIFLIATEDQQTSFKRARAVILDNSIDPD